MGLPTAGLASGKIQGASGALLLHAEMDGDPVRTRLCATCTPVHICSVGARRLRAEEVGGSISKVIVLVWGFERFFAVCSAYARRLTIASLGGSKSFFRLFTLFLRPRSRCVLAWAKVLRLPSLVDRRGVYTHFLCLGVSRWSPFFEINPGILCSGIGS